ncbi:unnamed protein product [Arabidopsis thaliana]|uniref:Uncharacterized protein n=1 Tax=Arabidopsis thaliana TaxID=3702 RepID=Q9LJ61_ARATH|nr:unnamed protein product [Arabidopsis thaliana]
MTRAKLGECNTLMKKPSGGSEAELNRVIGRYNGKKKSSEGSKRRVLTSECDSDQRPATATSDNIYCSIVCRWTQRPITSTIANNCRCVRLIAKNFSDQKLRSLVAGDCRYF